MTLNHEIRHLKQSEQNIVIRTAAEINLGETAALGCGRRGLTAVKPQIESAF